MLSHHLSEWVSVQVLDSIQKHSAVSQKQESVIYSFFKPGSVFCAHVNLFKKYGGYVLLLISASKHALLVQNVFDTAQTETRLLLK